MAIPSLLQQVFPEWCDLPIPTIRFLVSHKALPSLHGLNSERFGDLKPFSMNLRVLVLSVTTPMLTEILKVEMYEFLHSSAIFDFAIRNINHVWLKLAFLFVLLDPGFVAGPSGQTNLVAQP
jgi:hypothetical protein